MKDKNAQLLHALKLNAGFSSLCAPVMLITAPWIAAQLGLSSTIPVYVTAVVLILFAAQLWNIVRTRAFQTWEIAAIIGGDIVWVMASFVLVVLYFDSMTVTGLVLVDLVALAVLLFAILQIRGLRVIRDDHWDHDSEAA